MVERNSNDRPANQPRPDPTDQQTVQVVQSEGSGRAAWYVAGAVVLALLIVAFVVGTDGDGASEVGTSPADEIESVDPAVPDDTAAPAAEPDAQEPAAPEAEPEPTAEPDAETPPADDAALPPATEPEAVPDTNTAN